MHGIPYTVKDMPKHRRPREDDDNFRCAESVADKDESGHDIPYKGIPDLRRKKLRKNNVVSGCKKSEADESDTKRVMPNAGTVALSLVKL